MQVLDCDKRYEHQKFLPMLPRELVLRSQMLGGHRLSQACRQV